MTTKIPATVITGFLGAGKTTLIRHILANAQGRKLALIINEFGEVGVDAEILKSCGVEGCNEEDVIELANGCICCTVADDFLPAMNKILARKQRPDHIIVETSGLALPQPLVRAFNWPEVSAQVTVDSVLTVVDGKAIAEGRFATDQEALERQRQADPTLDHENPVEELFEDQLTAADLVIINKVDLLDHHERKAVEEMMTSKVRKATRFAKAVNGAIDLNVLLGIKAAAENDMGNRLSHHEQEGEIQHDHDDFISFAISLPPETDKETLMERIKKTIEAHAILRLKGFASVPTSASRLLIQAVGPRLTSYFDRPWKSGEVRRTQLVVIGSKEMDKASIEHSLRGDLH